MEKFKINSKIDRQWLENYWFYYKRHTIIGILIIILVGYTLVECANKVNPDLSIAYIGEKSFTQEISSQMEQTFGQYVDDINKDGKQVVGFSAMTIPKEPKTEQDMAMAQKAQLEIAAGESYLYIMDKEYFDQYAKQGVFLNLADKLGKTGEVYGVPLNNSSIFSSFGFKSNLNFYAGVRVITLGNEKKLKEISRQNNATKVILKLSE